MRRLAVWLLQALLLGSAFVVVPGAWGQLVETTGVLTEVKPGQGTVEIKRSGAPSRAAAPLMGLSAGDEIRVTEDAVVVVVLTGRRGTVRLDARNTPWTAPPLSTGGVLDKAQALVASSLSFLTGAATGRSDVIISTRGGGAPPRIVSPRGGSILGQPLVIEWSGSPSARYTLRISTPTGVVLERNGVAGPRFTYPDDAPALVAGVPYTVHVEVRGYAPQQATFEVVDPARRATMLGELAELEATLVAPPTSVATVKAGVLAKAGLLHDARQVVLTALATDPDEPTLHRVLGILYLKSGLKDEAARAFGDANALLSRRR